MLDLFRTIETSKRDLKILCSRNETVISVNKLAQVLCRDSVHSKLILMISSTKDVPIGIGFAQWDNRKLITLTFHLGLKNLQTTRSVDVCSFNEPRVVVWRDRIKETRIMSRRVKSRWNATPLKRNCFETLYISCTRATHTSIWVVAPCPVAFISSA